MFWVAGMILEAWDIELERVHSFAIILSENDTVLPNPFLIFQMDQVEGTNR